MKRRLRFPYSKLTRLHYSITFSNTFSLNPSNFLSVIRLPQSSSFQKPFAINKRYPFPLSMAYFNTFYRLHHPIIALCIRCGLFFFPCTAPGFLLVFLRFHFFFFFVAFVSLLPSYRSIFASFAFLLFFIDLSFLLSFSIVVTEQWLAPKPPHVLLHLLVHSLPQVHRHRLRRVRPLRRVRTPERRFLNKTTRGCTSGLPSTCSSRRLHNSLTTISPTY